MSEIVVVGSINVDLVFACKQRPKAGETVLGEKFLTIPGGKGANQAVAAAKLGGNVSIIGCVGDDIYGKKMIENFAVNGVDTSMIEVLDISTGVAGIMVDQEDNSIVVVPGANKLLNIKKIDGHIDAIKNAKIVILQLEIPMEVIEYVVDICSTNHITTILNPAPAKKLAEELIKKVSYITPNEHEAIEIFGDDDLDDLLQLYPNKLIITQGEQGVVFHDGEKKQHIPSLKVEVVDTTGAGDTFNGALGRYLLAGEPLFKAIEYANKAAAISITKYGAQGGMPTREEVER